jgi:hypothetical protein
LGVRIFEADRPRAADQAAGGGNAADCQAAGEDRLEKITPGKLSLGYRLTFHKKIIS